jgi:hypothetical protein
MTIGVHGSPWTPETARSEALRLLTIVRSGVDPVEAKKKAARLASNFEVAGYVDGFVTGYPPCRMSRAGTTRIRLLPARGPSGRFRSCLRSRIISALIRMTPCKRRMGLRRFCGKR